MQFRRMPRSLTPAARRVPPTLSPAAKTRLQALTVWQQTGDWRLAAQVFGLSRATLFRWRRRYVVPDLSRLESRSRRPHRLRRSVIPAVVVRRIRALRQQYPRWGREKLRILLWREGIRLAANTIDRGLARLRTPAASSNHPDWPSQRIDDGPPAPMPSVNHETMRPRLPAISSKSIRWMYGLSPA